MLRKHHTDVTFLESAVLRISISRTRYYAARVKRALDLRRFSAEVTASPPPLAIAFAGIFFGGFASTFALLGSEPIPLTTALAITTYCAAEFLISGDAGVLD